MRLLVANMGLKTRRGGRRPRVEVRSNVDFGWYDGNIALLEDDEVFPENPKVRVHFTDFEESEDEFWGLEILRSEAEIRKRVRLLSHQLQDKECFKVVQGIAVCANYKSSDGSECKYYDGVVTKVVKAAHERLDRVEICNCKFSIRWSEGPMRGTETTLKCPDISLIVARDVDHHPVVSFLLNFAKDHPVVTPLVPEDADVQPVLSQLAKPDASPPGYKLSSQRSPELELEVSLEEELEVEEVREQENTDGNPEINEDRKEQESLYEEEEKNHEQEDLREETLEVEVIQEWESTRKGDLEAVEVKELEQGRNKVDNSEIQEVQEAGVLRGEEPENEEYPAQEFKAKLQVQEKKVNDIILADEQDENTGADYMELDWDEELLVEKLMDESDSHYRVCEDKVIDLPRNVADHLRNFQLVQDCLAKGTLELEKFLLKQNKA
ncbi:hypothetical protein Mapa_008588 [Marchantia paleacea]|nr:hypothetical protein Mapa_008588 [Marchantia paleacea]